MDWHYTRLNADRHHLPPPPDGMPDSTLVPLPPDAPANPMEALNDDERDWVSRAIPLAESVLPELSEPSWEIRAEHPLADDGTIRYADLLLMPPDRSHLIIVEWKTGKQHNGFFRQMYHYLRMAINEFGLPERCSAAVIQPDIPETYKTYHDWRHELPAQRREYDPATLAKLKRRDILPLRNSFRRWQDDRT